MGSTLFSRRYESEISRCRKKRVKSFKTAEAAKKWAETNKVAKYNVVPLTYATKAKMKFVVKELK